MDCEYTKFIGKIIAISKSIESGRDLIQNYSIDSFQQKTYEIATSIDSIIEKDRNLKIGIVGEVKAGKSSFLNSLIFDGQTVLPKAGTPMTAALTKITYSTKAYAKVFFYTDYDWQVIEEFSKKHDIEYRNKYFLVEKAKNKINELIGTQDEQGIKEAIPPRYRACKELTELVKTNNLEVYSYLNKVHDVDEYESYIELIKKLNEYVGVNGKYTPIVKYVELGIDLDLLRDLEIIDTPGLNDPVISRSEATKNFLLNCDVVFLLSYSGQFMTVEDIEFITSVLPKENINHCVLIGSKLDSGILDHPEKNLPIRKALISSTLKYNNQAETNIKAVLNRDHSESKILESIMNSLPPEYISSLMYGISKKIENKQLLSDEETNILLRLKQRFTGFTESFEFYRDFSNIDNVRKKHFDIVREKKEKIIAQRINGLLTTQAAALLAIMDDIYISADENMHNLQKYDKEQMEKKLDVLMNNLNKTKNKVKRAFVLSAVETKKYINDITIEIQKEIEKHTDIDVISTTTTQREHEGMLWWKKTYNVSKTSYHSNVYDAIANIRNYILKSNEFINQIYKNMININELGSEIKTIVINVFESIGNEYDENDILIPLEIALKEIIVPTVILDTEKYNEMILSEFSSSVEGNEDIARLKVSQEKVLQTISKDFAMLLQDTSQNMEILLTERSEMFIDEIKDKIKDNIKIIKERLDDKAEAIKRYSKYIEEITIYKKDIYAIKK